MEGRQGRGRSPCRPSTGGLSGGGSGNVKRTVYSLGRFRSSGASCDSSSWFFLRHFCCFRVRASFVCFSWGRRGKGDIRTLHRRPRKAGRARVLLLLLRRPHPRKTQVLTACLVDLPPAFNSFSFFSCFSYCFSSSFCFCWYIFLKVTGAREGNGHRWLSLSPAGRGRMGAGVVV